MILLYDLSFLLDGELIFLKSWNIIFMNLSTFTLCTYGNISKTNVENPFVVLRILKGSSWSF